MSWSADPISLIISLNHTQIWHGGTEKNTLPVEYAEEICDVIRPPEVDEVVTTVAVDVAEDITFIAVPGPELLLMLPLLLMLLWFILFERLGEYLVLCLGWVM